ncbi:unnamed protein product [Phaeothamnion confervicola]
MSKNPEQWQREASVLVLRELAVLRKLLHRNRNQHRHAKYFDSAGHAVKAFDDLGPGRLPALIAAAEAAKAKLASTQSRNNRIQEACVNEAVILATQARDAVTLCAQALSCTAKAAMHFAHQVSRSLFMAFAMVLMACQARLFTCGLHLAARLVDVHRRLLAALQIHPVATTYLPPGALRTCHIAPAARLAIDQLRTAALTGEAGSTAPPALPVGSGVRNGGNGGGNGSNVARSNGGGSANNGASGSGGGGDGNNGSGVANSVDGEDIGEHFEPCAVPLSEPVRGRGPAAASAMKASVAVPAVSGGQQPLPPSSSRPLLAADYSDSSGDEGCSISLFEPLPQEDGPAAVASAAAVAAATAAAAVAATELLPLVRDTRGEQPLASSNLAAAVRRPSAAALTGDGGAAPMPFGGVTSTPRREPAKTARVAERRLEPMEKSIKSVDHAKVAVAAADVAPGRLESEKRKENRKGRKARLGWSGDPPAIHAAPDKKVGAATAAATTAAPPAEAAAVPAAAGVGKTAEAAVTPSAAMPPTAARPAPAARPVLAPAAAAAVVLPARSLDVARHQLLPAVASWSPQQIAPSESAQAKTASRRPKRAKAVADDIDDIFGAVVVKKGKLKKRKRAEGDADGPSIKRSGAGGRDS